MDQMQLQRAAEGSHDTEILAKVVVDLVLHDWSRTHRFLGALLPIQGPLARPVKRDDLVLWISWPPSIFASTASRPCRRVGPRQVILQHPR